MKSEIIQSEKRIIPFTLDLREGLFGFPLSFAEQMGFEESYVTYDTFLERVPENDQANFGRLWEGAQTEPIEIQSNFELRDLSGNARGFYIEAQLVPNPQESSTLIKGYLVQNASSELHQQRLAELQELLEMKDQSLAMIAHDLRNPISQVDGVLRLLKEEIEAEGQKEILKMAFDALDHTYQILGELNDATRNKVEGRSKIKLQEVPVKQLLKRLGNSFKIKLEEKDLTLKITAANQEVVWANEQKILRAIENLLSNAIKFSPKHGVITIRSWQESTCTCIEVADQGIGMPEDIRQNLFQGMNDSIRRAGTNGEQSIGIGLSIVKGVVDVHKGSIRVESEEGRGSRFIVCLPKPKA